MLILKLGEKQARFKGTKEHGHPVVDRSMLSCIETQNQDFLPNYF